MNLVSIALRPRSKYNVSYNVLEVINGIVFYNFLKLPRGEGKERERAREKAAFSLSLEDSLYLSHAFSPAARLTPLYPNLFHESLTTAVFIHDSGKSSRSRACA